MYSWFKKGLIALLAICMMAFMANFAVAGSSPTVDKAESWSMNNEGLASGGGSAAVDAQADYASPWNYGWQNDNMVHDDAFHPYGPVDDGEWGGQNLSGLPAVDGPATATFNAHTRNIGNSVTATGDNVDLWTRHQVYESGEGWVYDTYRGNSGYLFDSNFVGAEQQDGDTVAGGNAQQNGYVEYDARAKGTDGGETSGSAKSRGTQAVSSYANEGTDQSTAAMFAGSSSARDGEASSSIDGSGYLNTQAELEGTGSVEGGTFAAHSDNQAWTHGSGEFAYQSSAASGTQHVSNGGSTDANVGASGGAFTYGKSTVGAESASAYQKSFSTTGDAVSATAGTSVSGMSNMDNND